jgi:hypothetical protein
MKIVWYGKLYDFDILTFGKIWPDYKFHFCEKNCSFSIELPAYN